MHLYPHTHESRLRLAPIPSIHLLDLYLSLRRETLTMQIHHLVFASGVVSLFGVLVSGLVVMPSCVSEYFTNFDFFVFFHCR